MCVCVCVCVSEISEFAQNENDNNSSEFLFIKKEEEKKKLCSIRWDIILFYSMYFIWIYLTIKIGPKLGEVRIKQCATNLKVQMLLTKICIYLYYYFSEYMILRGQFLIVSWQAARCYRSLIFSLREWLWGKWIYHFSYSSVRQFLVLHSYDITAHEILAVWTVDAQIFVASLGSEDQTGTVHIKASTWTTINLL